MTGGQLQKRIQMVPEGKGVKECINLSREEVRMTSYRDEVSPHHWHRLASRNGYPLKINSERTRQEETTLHQLRVNRTSFLANTQYRFGRIDSPICQNLDKEVVEDAYHFLKCQRWAKQREQTARQATTTGGPSQSSSNIAQIEIYGKLL